jgi:hypothetical protein
VYRFAQLIPGDYVAGVITTLATVPVAAQEAYATSIVNGTLSPYQQGVDAGAGSPLARPGGLHIGSFLLKTTMDVPGLGLLSDAPRVLPPGADGRLFVYPTVYYPSATTATQATVISVRAGEERSNVDFQLRPLSAVRVSGSVIGPDGPSPNTEVSLLAAGSEMLAREATNEAGVAVSDAMGNFTFLGVTPGQYTIRVLRAPPRAEPDLSQRTSTVVTVGNSSIVSVVAGPPTPIPLLPTLSAVLPVSVGDRDLTGLSVPLRPGARIQGHVEFVGTAPPPTADQMRRVTLTIDSADGRGIGPFSASQIRQGQVGADGHVQSYQLPPGRYVIRGSAVAGWTFASALIDGKDVSDMPFDLGASDINSLVVRYTDKPADLSGTVRDTSRAPTSIGQVLLFPADTRAWTAYGAVSRRLRGAAPGKDGTFRITAVPPGDYWLVAVPDEATANWQDPPTLEKLAALATAVTIGDGEKKVQDLVLRPVK